MRGCSGLAVIQYAPLRPQPTYLPQTQPTRRSVIELERVPTTFSLARHNYKFVMKLGYHSARLTKRLNEHLNGLSPESRSNQTTSFPYNFCHLRTCIFILIRWKLLLGYQKSEFIFFCNSNAKILI